MKSEFPTYFRKYHRLFYLTFQKDNIPCLFVILTVTELQPFELVEVRGSTS